MPCYHLVSAGALRILRRPWLELCGSPCPLPKPSLAQVCMVVGAGLSFEWRRLENVVHAGAAFPAYTHSVGAGLPPKIKPVPTVIHTCAAHTAHLLHPYGRPAPFIVQTCAAERLWPICVAHLHHPWYRPAPFIVHTCTIRSTYLRRAFLLTLFRKAPIFGRQRQAFPGAPKAPGKAWRSSPSSY